MPPTSYTSKTGNRVRREYPRLATPEPTVAPTVTIVARGADGGEPYVEYQDTDVRAAHARWIVRGQCNRCGLCVLGLMNDDDYDWHGLPGTPGAVTDRRVASGRPDEPVFPGFLEDMRDTAAQTPTATVAGCSLMIEVIE